MQGQTVYKGRWPLPAHSPRCVFGEGTPICRPEFAPIQFADPKIDRTELAQANLGCAHHQTGRATGSAPKDRICVTLKLAPQNDAKYCHITAYRTARLRGPPAASPQTRELELGSQTPHCDCDCERTGTPERCNQVPHATCAQLARTPRPKCAVGAQSTRHQTAHGAFAISACSACRILRRHPPTPCRNRNDSPAYSPPQSVSFGSHSGKR